jgi:hypothetical protein
LAGIGSSVLLSPAAAFVTYILSPLSKIVVLPTKL